MLVQVKARGVRYSFEGHQNWSNWANLQFFSCQISAEISKNVEIWHAHVATLTNDPQ